MIFLKLKVFCRNNTSQKKWLMNYSDNPNKNNIKNHFEIISKALDAFYTKYEA